MLNAYPYASLRLRLFFFLQRTRQKYSVSRYTDSVSSIATPLLVVPIDLAVMPFPNHQVLVAVAALPACCSGRLIVS